MVEDALPPSTEVSAEWTAPAGDTGQVDDGWLKSFDDPELEALVKEALDEHNPNMRLLDTIANLTAGLFAPLYTGGALEAQVESATADQEAAIAVYGQSLLQAFEEVETALTNEGLFSEREKYLLSSEDNSKKAYDLARAKYDVGQTDLLSVLQIQFQWVGSRMGVVDIRSDRLTQRVDLHLALGGSFETAAD